MAGWVDSLRGVISESDLNQAREVQKGGKSPVDFLLSNKLVGARALLEAMSDHYRLPYLELDGYHPKKQALMKVPEEIARRFGLLPLFQLGDRLHVAVWNPEDLAAQEYIRQLTGLDVDLVLATKEALERGINRHYLSKEHSAQVLEVLAHEKPEEKRSEKPVIQFENEDAPVIKVLNHIFSQAVHLGASDIHLEPYPHRVVLKYRIDGILHEFPAAPEPMYRNLVSRIKVLSGLDIAERRLPQDGRARIQVEGRDFDLRVSIIPDLHGEGAAIRILDSGVMARTLAELGFSEKLLNSYKKLVLKPYGIFLVTGPTGSGKTTTLYATLKHLYTPRKKFITLEDPVEYQLEGVKQIQVEPDIGYTFAVGLRSILRHDPDVILLGEVRDLESAEIALRCSLTGHLVLSTLHTNDALSAVTRLADMGLQSYLIHSSLIGVLAQRLLRRLCSACKKAAVPSRDELASLGLTDLPESAHFYRPAGCSLCGNLGYKGRLAIGEILEITPEFKHISADGLVSEGAANSLRKQGFISLRETAIEQMCLGNTSLEEVLNVTMEMR